MYHDDDERDHAEEAANEQTIREEQEPAARYAYGWNLPGCLPESEPGTDVSFNGAVGALASEVDRHWDEDYQGADAEANSVLRGQARLAVDETYLDLHTALHNAPVAHDDGTHTFSQAGGKGLTYWVQPLTD